MKHILVTGYTMEIGGVQKALLGLINSYDYSHNKIDLLLMCPEGEFMQYINKEVTVLDTPSFFSWVLLPKGKVMHSIATLFTRPLIMYYFCKNIIWGICKKNMAQARQRMWKDVIKYVPSLSGHYDEVLDFSGLMRRYVLNKVNADYKATWIHSDFRVFGLDKEIEGKLLSRFDSINCVSDTCKKIFDNEFPNIKDKSVVKLNTIDLSFIRQHLNDVSFNDDFTGVRLLDVTRIDPNKGLDIAVKVCRKLKDRNINLKWYVLGSDPLGYKVTLEKLIKEEGVEDYFVLLGFTKNPYPYMNDADIIVHFSRFEGRSVSIDEALALHKTIVLTNYPTAKDQINNGKNGYICDFDEGELTKLLENLIKQKEGGIYD